MKTKILLPLIIVLMIVMGHNKSINAQSDNARWYNGSVYAKEGPYAVVTDSAYIGAQNIRVHRPVNAGHGPYPVMMFHQGGPGFLTPRTYDLFTKHLASYGYVVVVLAAKFPPNPLNDDFSTILEWMEGQVVQGVSEWADYADLSKIVVGGHSFGGIVATTFIANHPERAIGIVYFASYAAPEPLQPIAPYPGKVLMLGGMEDALTSPENITATFERFVTASCKSKALIDGIAHGAFGDYEKDPVGSIGREKATEVIRHFFVSFMENATKDNAWAGLNLLNPYQHPVKVAEFDSSCSPFNDPEHDKVLQGVRIFPNPIVYQVLTLYVEDISEYSYQIRDFTSTLHRSDGGLTGASTINVSDLPSGVYYIIVRAEGKRKVVRFFKW